MLSFHHSQFVSNFLNVFFFLLFPQTHSGETWGRITKLMGGPEGEFPAPWFANRGLVPLSFPCNRGSGLWSLPSPPVRGLTKCTDCTLCVLVKARLPSLWRLGTGKEDRGPRCGWKKRLKLLTYGFFVGQFPSSLGIVEGTSLKITWSRPKVLFTCGRPTMEMQRWSTRWKTKRWLMDSTVTAFITLILVLQATNVSAGKIIRDQTSLMNFMWPKGDGAVIGWENSVTDDGDWGIRRFTWTPRRHVCFVVKFTCFSPFHIQNSYSKARLLPIPVWLSAVWKPPKQKAYSETNLLTTVVKRTVKPCSGGNLNSTCSQGMITWGAHILLAETLYSVTQLTAGYFYAWMESVRPEDETPRLIKFILSCCYVLIEIRETEQRSMLFKIHLGWKKALCLNCGPLGGCGHG